MHDRHLPDQLGHQKLVAPCASTAPRKGERERPSRGGHYRLARARLTDEQALGPAALNCCSRSPALAAPKEKLWIDIEHVGSMDARRAGVFPWPIDAVHLAPWG